jgi:hypothetical protein
MKGIADIADTVEFQTWAKGEGYTFDALKDELNAALGDGEDAEVVAQNVMDEIQYRQRLLAASYPFECDGYKLRVKGENAGKSTYLFCLALSLLPPVHIENEQRSVQFETIALAAAKNFFGGDALRIGAPWRTAEIQTYEDLLNRVVELIPNLGVLLNKTAPHGGDAGWDVLIVKNFRDNHFPRLVVLGNCATGHTDWKRKGRETEPEYFWSYFTHPHRSACILFFAVPFTMDDDTRLRKISSMTLTFDRFRICENAPQLSEDVEQWVESIRAAALEVALN